MDDDKQKILSEIFWEMNEVSSRIEAGTYKVEARDISDKIIRTLSGKED